MSTVPQPQPEDHTVQRCSVASSNFDAHHTALELNLFNLAGAQECAKQSPLNVLARTKRRHLTSYGIV